MPKKASNKKHKNTHHKALS